MFNSPFKNRLPTVAEALPGRATPLRITNHHAVNGQPLQPPFPAHLRSALFGMGCFWGAEKQFWPLPGVFTTAVGYAGGTTPHPTYQEVCSGQTGHNEVVLVVYDPAEIDYERLLCHFWEAHNPTQGMRQGNDVGTQYRSGIYTFSPAQQSVAVTSKARYQTLLNQANCGTITTEILAAPTFYYAEEYHQQYLAKNPGGYCGLGGCGVVFYEQPLI